MFLLSPGMHVFFWPRNVNILCGGWGRGVGVCRLEFFSKVKMRHFTSFSTVEIMLRHTASVDHPKCWPELPQVTQCTIPHVDLSFHRSLSAPSHMFTWAPTGHSVDHPTCWPELPQVTQCTMPHVHLSSHRSLSAPSHMFTWAPTGHSVHHPTCSPELPQVTQCTIPHVHLSSHRSLSAPSHMLTWAPTGPPVHHPTCWPELPQVTQCTIPHVHLSSHRSLSAPSHMLTWAPTGHSVHHPTCWLELPQMTQCTIPHVDLSFHRSPSAPSHMLTWAPTHSVHPLYIYSQGPRWRSGNTLASHLWGRWLKPRTLCGKAGSCLPMVSSLQYITLTNCMHWFLLPTKLPVVIWAVQCWKQR